MAEKIIRDPVHDLIVFRTERPIDTLLFNLVNAAEVQRLRRIRQLGMASLAYPGADHSRYGHSLGVMETSRKILDRLRPDVVWDEIDEAAALCAALLHDLGHGPFSHVFERVTGTSHEDLTRQTLLNPETEVHQRLTSYDPSLPQRVVDVLEGRAPRRFFGDMISSQLDADRFDYLLRDDLMSGAGYGRYDLRWLIQALNVDPASERLTVSYKGVSAAEGFLQARAHMYRNVYFHKVVRSAEGMLRLALRRAKSLVAAGKIPLLREDDSVHRLLSGKPLTSGQFTDLDDVSVLHCFKQWSKSADATLAKLCHGLLFRDLYKAVQLPVGCAEGNITAIVDAASHAIRKAAGDPDYDLFVDSPSDTPYESFRPDDPLAAKDIMVRQRDGALVRLIDVSQYVKALDRRETYCRLHVAAPYHALVRAGVAD